MKDNTKAGYMINHLVTPMIIESIPGSAGPVRHTLKWIPTNVPQA